MYKRKFKYTVNDVLAHAQGRWPEIIAALSCHDVSGILHSRRHIDCPIHGGKRDFRAFKDFAETGGTICSCSKNPNGLVTLQFLNHWDFKEAINAVREYLGLLEDDDVPVKPAPKLKPVKRGIEPNQKAIDDLQTVYRRSVSLSHPSAEPARLYLVNRNIDFEVPDQEIRYVDDLHFYDEVNECSLGHHPAIIMVIRSHQGIPLSLHRTYLSRDGFKANVPQPKKLMVCSADRALSELGCAIRLAEVFGDVMGIAEGFETAVAAMKASGIPTWAAVSAPLLEKFSPPSNVRYLVHWIDKDRSKAGEESALKLKASCQLKGITYIPALPSMSIPDDSKSIDWWDVWAQHDVEDFARINALVEQVRSANHA